MKLQFLSAHAVRVEKSRADVVNSRQVPMQQVNVTHHPIANPHKPKRAAKRTNNEWWESKTPAFQKRYRTLHPKSKKIPKSHQHDHANVNEIPTKSTEKQSKPILHDDSEKEDNKEVIRKSGEGTTIKWSEHAKPLEPGSLEALQAEKDYQEKEAEHQKISEEMQKRIAARKGSAIKTNDPGLAFLMRFGRTKFSQKIEQQMAPDEKKKYRDELANWQQNYGKLDASDLADVARQHYRANPEHAAQDGVDVGHPDPDDNKTEEDRINSARDDAEENDTAKAPKVKDIFDRAYDTNPLSNFSKKTQKLLTTRAVTKISQAFSADKNEIIGNTYQFLNSDQINLLDQAAEDALHENLTAIHKRMQPIRRKRLLKMLFVAVAVAAGIASGGVPLALLCMQHSLVLSGHDGRTHEVIWNALRGKNADGSDDPDFDAHDDAVEKIVRSLKKQLFATDNEDEAEHIQEVIDNLEEQQDNYHQTKYSGGRKPTKRKKHKVHAKAVKIRKPAALPEDVTIKKVPTYGHSLHIYNIYHKGKLAGDTVIQSVFKSKTSNDPIHADTSKLKRGFQRQNIMSHAYDKIEKNLGKKLHPSPYLSENAIKFWKKRMKRYSSDERKTMLDNLKKHGPKFGYNSLDHFKSLNKFY